MNFEQIVDAYITAEMQRKQIPGLSLAVVKNGTAVVDKSYGLANVEPCGGYLLHPFYFLD